MTTIGSFSNYAETAVLNNFFKNTAYTTRVNTYLALYTSDPTDADIGNEVSSIGTGYVRQPVVWSEPAIITITGEFENKYAIKNNADIAFPKALTDWGLVTHWGIRDTDTAGNLLAHGQVEVAANITSGNEYIFTAGNTVLALTGECYSDATAKAILNLIFRNTPQVPTPLYLALYSTDPTASDTGIEVTGGGYTRQSITFGAIVQDGSGRAVIKNPAAIEFPVATASYPTVTHLGIRTASTGGTLLVYTPANQAIALQQSEQYKIDVDNLIIGVH